MKKIVTVIVLLMTMFITGFAQSTTDLNAPLPINPNIRMGKLPNGMTYYIMRNTKPEHRAEFRLAVNVGSTQENDDQQGLAHFTEHMAFNGSAHFQKNDLVDYIESIGSKFGADLNAYTSFDETVYMLQVPTDSVQIIDKAFLIYEDWAHNLSFDPTEIDKERGVVTEEWRLGQGANERMRRQYWPTMFKDSRYAVRLPIGKKDILQNCKYETLSSFYHEWYRPENMAFIVIGDINVDEMEAKIKKQFTFKNTNPTRTLQSFPVPDTHGVIVSKATDKEATNTVIQILYKLPKEAVKTVGDFRKDLIADVYNTMLGARMRELTQQENPPFVFGNTSYSGLVRTKNAYRSFAVVKDGGIERGIETLVTENQRVKKYGFTTTELERIKKEMIRNVETQYNEKDKTDSKNFTRAIVANFLDAEPIPGIAYEYEFYKKQLPSITIEEVNALAKKWIHEDDAMVVITGPEKGAATMPTDDKVKEILKNVMTKDIKPYEDKVSDSPLLANKPTAGKVVDVKETKEMGITTWKLSNGATIILKPTDFKNDEIIFTGFSMGGTSLVADKDYLNASECATIIDNGGIGSFDAVQLQKQLAGKVANVNPYIDDAKQGFTGHCAPSDMEMMFQLVYLYFTNLNKSKTDFQAYIEREKGLLQNRSSSPDAAFQDTIKVTMGQYNLRSNPMTEKQLAEINMDRVFEIFQERFADANGFTFTFVGNFKPETIKPMIELYIGGIPMKANKGVEKCKDLGLNPPKGKIEKTIRRGIEPKSSVSIKLTNKFVYNRKNRNDLNLLMRLVSIKLREQMREEKSGVYGVRATPSMSHYPTQSYELNFGWGCAPENVEILIKTMWEEIEKIKATGCNDKDMLKIKETALRERETYLKENRFWLGAINNSAFDGENILELNDYTAYVNGLKSDDFKRLANQYLTKENMAQFTLIPTIK